MVKSGLEVMLAGGLPSLGKARLGLLWPNGGTLGDRPLDDACTGAEDLFHAVSHLRRRAGARQNGNGDPGRDQRSGPRTHGSRPASRWSTASRKETLRSGR